ncbi:AEC family transporter [Vibrio mexicanus]|uniref:AEC family transporter n=1 Tax=Vibrio mexicanus TaxID=1004326 RepID=UPI000B013928|nr:AEC family transporter [Vibrio mexicanus]
MLVENLLFIPLSLILLETASGQNTSLSQRLMTIFDRLRRNPIIIAILVAITVNVMAIQVPLAIQSSVTMFAQTSIALALFAIGGLLAQSTKLVQIPRLSVVAIIKLVMFPLFAFGLLYLFPVEGDLAVALLIFSASPMLSIYPILGGLYQQHTFCTNTLVTTTVASGVSLSVVVALIS